MTDSITLPLLASRPHFALGHWPTPLHLLDNLSKELAGPRIWLKRDDCSGLATGGNKTRKLEYLVGAALAAGADTLVTFGAVQSNHARQTAAAAARAGLGCELLLTRQVPISGRLYERGGNMLFNQLLGARVHLFDADDHDGLEARLTEIQSQHACYVIPAGGSSDVGALGYMAAAVELHNQCRQADIPLTDIVHASSSAGTQAGLLAGMQALQAHPRIVGINVYHADPAQLSKRINNLVARIYSNNPELPQPHQALPVEVNHAYLGPGYGQPDAATLDAIRMAAELEGVLFDPAYSGKALAALIDQVNIGAFKHTDDVVLIHTGGTQSLNVYADAF